MICLNSKVLGLLMRDKILAPPMKNTKVKKSKRSINITLKSLVAPIRNLKILQHMLHTLVPIKRIYNSFRAKEAINREVLENRIIKEREKRGRWEKF